MKLFGMILAMLLAATCARAEERTANLNISGMSCAACAATVENACLGVPGVKQAQVDLAKNTAVVRYDDAQVQPQGIADSVSKLGFKASAQE